MAISVKQEAVGKSVGFTPSSSIQVSLCGGATVEYFRDNLTIERAILTVTSGSLQISFHGTPMEVRDLVHGAQQVLDEALRQEHPTTGDKVLARVRADLEANPYRTERHPLDAERGR